MEPRALDDLDRLLGADPDGAAPGSLACFEPRMPAPADADGADWEALRDRYDDRWREWWGPVGDRLRALEEAGLIRVDRSDGIVRDAASGQPLRRLPDG